MELRVQICKGAWTLQTLAGATVFVNPVQVTIQRKPIDVGCSLVFEDPIEFFEKESLLYGPIWCRIIVSALKLLV